MVIDKSQKQKAQKLTRQRNVLESLKDIGGGTAQSIKSDVLRAGSEEFFGQLFGKLPEKKYTGDLVAGESLEINEVFSGKHEENLKLKKQLSFERRLHEEEKVRIEKKSNELKIQLHAIMQEVVTLAQTTQNLGEEVEIAAIQAPANPGVYHVFFFEKLLEFLRSFRKKIEDSAIWLHATNKRAEKKNYWAMYKKKGSSFLLAPDHYLQRSAG